jgi:hypothetical protein
VASDEDTDVLSRVEIERLVRDHLSGVAWAPVFEERTVIRKFGRMWVVHLAADRAGGPWILQTLEAESAMWTLRVPPNDSCESLPSLCSSSDWFCSWRTSIRNGGVVPR